MTAVWFRRLGDVPGVEYTSSARIDRATLPGHDATPDPRFLAWPTRDGSTSESPSKAHARSNEDAADADAVLQTLLEALELPGTTEDYHFIMLSGIERVWKFASSVPELLETVETLCLADIRLVEAFPAVVRMKTPTGTTYLRIPAFDLLIRLYRENGFLSEARQITRRARSFDNGSGEAEALDVVVESLKEEDGV